MIDQNSLNSANKIIEEASSVIILLPPNPSEDQVISAVSLHQILKNKDKQSQIGCSTPINLPNLTENNEIKDSIGQQNLTISFDYSEENLEKVDYDVRSNGQFFLVIKPKAGSPVPDISNVKFSYTGASADLVIVIGISTLEELGKIYSDEKDFLDTASILSFNLNPKPLSFSATSILTQNLTSYIETIGSLAESLTLSVPAETATRIISSIYSQTQNLSSTKLTADTFSTISYLMRQGGSINQRPSFTPPTYSQPQYFEVPSFDTPTKANPVYHKNSQTASKNVPKDWQKPKIFRSNQK